MKQQAETTPHRRRDAWLGIAALVVILGAGCDSRVKVSGPTIVPPTIPTSPTTPPSGAMVTEERPIAGVDSVALEAVGVVEIDLGAAETLRITAPESLMPMLTSDVAGGLLELDRRTSSYRGEASDIHYEIGLRRLDELMLHGVGQIAVRGLDATRFTVRMDGVGGVDASGRAERQEVRIAGVGAYRAQGLESRIAEVHLSNGSAAIWATERIDGWVGFGATLEYWGDPKVSVRGQGTVRRLGPEK